MNLPLNLAMTLANPSKALLGELLNMAASIFQASANRANAQLSTGPRTFEGKMQSRQNAYKHGFKALVIPCVEPSDEVEAARDRWLACFPGDDEVTRTIADVAFRAKRRFESVADADDAALALRVEKTIETHYLDLHASIDEAWAAFCEDPNVGFEPMLQSESGCKTLLVKMNDLLKKSRTDCWEECDGQRLLALEGLDGKEDVDRMTSIFETYQATILCEAMSTDTSECSAERAEHREQFTAGLEMMTEARRIARVELGSRIMELIGPVQRKLLRIEGSDQRTVSLKRDAAKFDPSDEARLRRRYLAESQRDFLKVVGEARKISGLVPPKAAAPKVETAEPEAEGEESEGSGEVGNASPNEAKSIYSGGDESNGQGGVVDLPIRSNGPNRGPKRSS